MNANRGSFPGRHTHAAEAAIRQRKPLGRLVPNPKLKFLDQCRETSNIQHSTFNICPVAPGITERLPSAFLHS
jgi:hypothetical protein